MHIDLNVPIPEPAVQPQQHGQSSKKNKGKQPQVQATQPVTCAFSAAQVSKIESRIDLLVRLGYTVLALTQNVVSKVDTKSHTNTLDALLPSLRKREGILFLKRLTIELDNESEKGFGLTQQGTQLFNSYDILALRPTTPSTLSLACLTHTIPSPLTAHIISLPLTSPQSLRLKHTLVRTAIKNGAVFEIEYSGALEENDSERRNWWAGAREVARVTKGKSVIVSGGTETCPLLRAPRDAGNLLTLVGLAQDQAHHAATTTAKSLILRAQTRKTYRAILSEPKLIMPKTIMQASGVQTDNNAESESNSGPRPEILPSNPPNSSESKAVESITEITEPIITASTSSITAPPESTSEKPEVKKTGDTTTLNGAANEKKRTHDQLNLDDLDTAAPINQDGRQNDQVDGQGNRKRKKKGKGKA